MIDILKPLAIAQLHSESWSDEAFANAISSISKHARSLHDSGAGEDWAMFVRHGELAFALWGVLPFALVRADLADVMLAPETIVTQPVADFGVPDIVVDEALVERFPASGFELELGDGQSPILISPLDFINSTI